MIGDNTFAFQFHSECDRHKVLMGGPWTFNDNLIVLVVPTGVGQTSNMKFDLPLLRVCVRLEAYVSILIVLLRYKHLPELCFKCGILGHPLRECPKLLPGVLFPSLFKYGSWIKASFGDRLWHKPKTEFRGK
ncbi:hypothetical protein JRO89_XS15G0126200 [Xanthoceras sorbifolium]|uniref:CCHC-type domain-containing protein n=1 Tax=Xanthoceras sorbifolium TaxID=99658 RepID=A0ABQ8H1V1_9ROSI|nr:hypothetical protein JRO89_XS15G0126200 [Xanthoceras sorbifolium]